MNKSTPLITNGTTGSDKLASDVPSQPSVAGDVKEAQPAPEPNPPVLSITVTSPTAQGSPIVVRPASVVPSTPATSPASGDSVRSNVSLHSGQGVPSTPAPSPASGSSVRSNVSLHSGQGVPSTPAPSPASGDSGRSITSLQSVALTPPPPIVIAPPPAAGLANGPKPGNLSASPSLQSS